MKHVGNHSIREDLPEPNAHELQRTQKLFLFVGIILFILTGTTVAVATVPWLDFGERGFDHVDAIIGLTIATFKASLVALIFMHLNHEMRPIYWIIGLATLHAIGFLVGTYMHFADMPHYDPFYRSTQTSENWDMMTDMDETKTGPP